MSTDVLVAESQPINLCMQGDLIPNSGICAELDGQQIALFYLPNESPQLYALGNWDPIGKANILSRGMVGDLDGRLVVARTRDGAVYERIEQSPPPEALAFLAALRAQRPSKDGGRFSRKATMPS